MFRITYVQKTDRGHVRENNEDAMSAALSDDPKIVEKKGGLFVVADGLGGLARGEVASSEAVNTLLELYHKRKALGKPEWLAEAFRTVNSKIYRRNQIEDPLDPMATTLTASLFHRETLTIAHVGDCRVYRVRDGQITCLTRDHSVSRHSLTRAIGTEARVEVDLHPLELRRGDTYIQCSDGLYAMVDEGEICDQVSRHLPEVSAPQLVQSANARGGVDNITLQVIQIA